MARLFPLNLWSLLRGFWRWLHLMADLSATRGQGVFESAHGFLQEREAWAAVMSSVQFSARGSASVMEGLARRHGSVIYEPFDDLPDEKLLRQITPLIWFLYHQKERFPENTVGHGATITLLYTLFRASRPGATRHQVIQAVRAEMDAQFQDACAASNPDGQGIFS